MKRLNGSLKKQRRAWLKEVGETQADRQVENLYEFSLQGDDADKPWDFLLQIKEGKAYLA